MVLSCNFGNKCPQSFSYYERWLQSVKCAENSLLPHSFSPGDNADASMCARAQIPVCFPGQFPDTSLAVSIVFQNVFSLTSCLLLFLVEVCNFLCDIPENYF